uniref:Beta-insect excitatory toxin LqhIT1b n=1 Tax=Leiurus hebraeus TaxID=2899558 RepID=SIX1B_LEIHE|nr:RecName: Full=Beta-insect excitatory toxin LqhIT1b; AltName: Full=Insect neurotoxin 1b; AltName: Full=Lqh IT1-b; Short=LqhIT1-b; AltName: Full=Lqh-xtrITb; Flags: Precursor [Leiurus quinquestriatus hebraeus]
MKFFLLFLVVLPIMGVLGKKNGYAVDSKGKAPECFLSNYCNNECTKVHYADKGYCCLLSCYCFGLNDDKKVLEISDTTKKYCDFTIIN